MLSAITTTIVKIIAILFICPLIFCYTTSRMIEVVLIPPEALFESGVDQPIPDSVVFINHDMEVFGFDTSYTLHFQISPEDFDHILNNNSHGFEYEKLDEPNDFEMNQYQVPESLRQESIQYDCIVPREDAGKYTCSMWVNEEKTEVFFLYVGF